MKKTNLFSILIALLAMLTIGCSSKHHSTDSGDPDANLPDLPNDTPAVTDTTDTDTTTLNDGKAIRVSVISDGSTTIKLAKTSSQPVIGCPYGVDLCFGNVFRSEEFQLIVQNATDTAIRNLTLTQTLGGARAWVVTPGLIPVLDLPGKSSLIPIITVGIPHGTPLYKITKEDYQWDGMDDSKGVVVDTLVFKWDGGEEKFTMAIVARIARMHATADDIVQVTKTFTSSGETVKYQQLNSMHVMGNCQVWDAGVPSAGTGNMLNPVESSWIPHEPGDTLVAYPDPTDIVETTGEPMPAWAASDRYYSECQHYVQSNGARSSWGMFFHDDAISNIITYNWYGTGLGDPWNDVTAADFW
jgi:hypothetical protein